MSNVIKLPTWRPRTFDSAEALLDAMREQRRTDKRKHAQIAKEVGVSPSTIGNFASGKTRWPRPSTLFPLLKALDLELQLVPRKHR